MMFRIAESFCSNSKLHALLMFLKDSIFLKNRHFIIQVRFNKLKYGINTIIKCGTRQPVNFSESLDFRTRAK